jgi:hypothetical protein
MEMLERREREKAGGDRKPKFHDETLLPTLDELGITRIESHRW